MSQTRAALEGTVADARAQWYSYEDGAFRNKVQYLAHKLGVNAHVLLISTTTNVGFEFTVLYSRLASAPQSKELEGVMEVRDVSQLLCVPNQSGGYAVSEWQLPS